MIPPSRAQQSLLVLNQVVYCDPSGWSEDRGAEETLLFLSVTQNPQTCNFHGNAQLPQDVPTGLKTSGDEAFTGR